MSKILQNSSQNESKKIIAINDDLVQKLFINTGWQVAKNNKAKKSMNLQKESLSIDTCNFKIKLIR